MTAIPPCFFHVESSSRHPPAFPAEVYWDDGAGGYGYVINPEGVERWLAWGKEFYRVHHITAADLRDYGTPPAEVCRQLSTDLGGRTVYSQQPERDRALVDELYSATGGQRPGFALEGVDDLCLGRLRDVVGGRAYAVLRRLKDEAKAEMPLTDGAFSMPYLHKLWGLVRKYGGEWP